MIEAMDTLDAIRLMKRDYENTFALTERDAEHAFHVVTNFGGGNRAILSCGKTYLHEERGQSTPRPGDMIVMLKARQIWRCVPDERQRLKYRPVKIYG